MRRTHKLKSTNTTGRDGSAHSSDEASVAELLRESTGANWKRQEEYLKAIKSYQIRKEELREAWLSVKRSGGGPGIDGQSIEDFERDLENNLYKLWKRMSSGSYYPKEIKQVAIPKGDGSQRLLGIPTVTDRVAQMVIHKQLEPELEKVFHPNSYGFRRGKSAHEAVKQCREKCFTYGWVIDLDIAKYFDTINHGILMQMVEKHAKEKSQLLYIKRWLKAPSVDAAGQQSARWQGTPQGGVISPLLANLYLHYAFDRWISEQYSTIPFERYADDLVLHCISHKQAKFILEQVTKRLEGFGLKLHPTKTKIVHCKNSYREEHFLNNKFSFLGFDFKPRRARSKEGRLYTVFTPAVSQKNKTKFLKIIRELRIGSQTIEPIESIAKQCKQVTRGWINYFKVFRSSELQGTLRFINRWLIYWAKRKYKTSLRRAKELLLRIAKQQPMLFPHWQFGVLP